MYSLLLQNNIHSNTLQTLPVMLHSSEVRHMSVSCSLQLLFELMGYALNSGRKEWNNLQCTMFSKAFAS
jgi:hypothetical protein